jgi:hypothetical protein
MSIQLPVGAAHVGIKLNMAARMLTVSLWHVRCLVAKLRGALKLQLHETTLGSNTAADYDCGTWMTPRHLQGWGWIDWCLHAAAAAAQPLNEV